MQEGSGWSTSCWHHQGITRYRSMVPLANSQRTNLPGNREDDTEAGKKIIGEKKAAFVMLVFYWKLLLFSLF